MAWVKLTDDFYDNPKLSAVGPLGLALWTVGIAYCNRNLTDGFIPRGRARALLDFDGLAITHGMAGEDIDADYVIGMLLDAALWRKVDKGFEVNDYLEFQPSKAEVIELREKRSKAGSLAAAARWGAADG